jgi:hypothetical protein
METGRLLPLIAQDEYKSHEKKLNPRAYIPNSLSALRYYSSLPTAAAVESYRLWRGCICIS